MSFSTLALLVLLQSPLLQPAVRWTTATRQDLGLLERGQPRSFDFTFVNAGDVPLTVETVRTTCGCTVPDWPRRPTLPDSTGRIRVTYDAQKKGAFRKTIKVYFYEIREAEKLYIEGQVQ